MSFWCLIVWLANINGLEELFPPSSGRLLWLELRLWVRRRIFPPKCWYPPIRLNGVNPNRALKLFSSYITWRNVWFEFPERNCVVGFKIMNHMWPAGFNMDLVLWIARNPESGLGTDGHSYVDSLQCLLHLHTVCKDRIGNNTCVVANQSALT